VKTSVAQGRYLLSLAEPILAGLDNSHIAYLVSSHLAYHLGQLVTWRAAAGLGRIRRPDVLAAQKAESQCLA
jgi:hypothetical protein